MSLIGVTLLVRKPSWMRITWRVPRYGLVGDQHDRAALVVAAVSNGVQDVVAGDRVEVAGGLVGKDEVRGCSRVRARWRRAASGRRRVSLERCVHSFSVSDATASSAAMAARHCALLGLRHARVDASGIVTLRMTVARGSRLNDWNTKPTVSRARTCGELDGRRVRPRPRPRIR